MSITAEQRKEWRQHIEAWQLNASPRMWSAAELAGQILDALEQAERRAEAAEKLLRTLVDMYIANRGTASAFIKCITPSGAYELTPAQRRRDKYWKVWDAAMRLTEPESAKTKEATNV